MKLPSEASVWWEQGGTPAEACTVYPQLFSDCFLTEPSVCMRQREGETACVYVCEAEGGDTTPPPVDRASLTGWRGRWGHCNKANTHTHIFFSYGCYVLVSLSLSRLCAAILPQLAQKPPSLTDLLPLFASSPPPPRPPVFTQPAKLQNVPLRFICLPSLPVPQSLPLWLYANITMLPLIWSAEGHMPFLAGKTTTCNSWGVQIVLLGFSLTTHQQTN